MTRAMLALLLGSCFLALTSAARAKSNKEWASMKEKDLDKLLEEWEDDEEREEYAYKPPQQGGGVDIDKLKSFKGNQKKIQEYVSESQVSAGPTMMFATVDYEGCCVKKETEKLANKWSSLLYTTGMDAQAYVIETDQILFSSQHGLHAKEIKEFALKQPECVAVEWNQNRVAGPAETPEWRAKDEIKKAERKVQEAATMKAKELGNKMPPDMEREGKLKGGKKKKKKKGKAAADKAEL